MVTLGLLTTMTLRTATMSSTALTPLAPTLSVKSVGWQLPNNVQNLPEFGQLFGAAAAMRCCIANAAWKINASLLMLLGSSMPLKVHCSITSDAARELIKFPRPGSWPAIEAAALALRRWLPHPGSKSRGKQHYSSMLARQAGNPLRMALHCRGHCEVHDGFMVAYFAASCRDKPGQRDPFGT